MADIKLIAIDLDGTLLRNDVSLSTYTKEVLGRAKEAGMQIVIATGRMFAGALPWGKELGLGEAPIICYTGAMVALCESQRVLYEQTIPLPVAQSVLKTIREQELYAQMYIDDTLYVPFYDDRTEEYEAHVGVRAHVLGDAFWKTEREPVKILLFERDARILGKAMKIMRMRYGNVTSQVKSQPEFFELSRKGCSKGAALSALCAEKDIAFENIMVFGNSENDLSMMALTPHSFAVANGEEIVRASAHHIVDSNEEDGVAKTVAAYLGE